MYKEKLTWILDKSDSKRYMADDELYRQNIAFVHSLGLKCDCVGWCEMWLDNPHTGEILAKIEQFCRENGWRARGYYTAYYENPNPEWFALDAKPFGVDNVADNREIPLSGGGSDTVPDVRAYKETSISPKKYYGTNYVPARFARACAEAGVTDVDFCWLHDTGKYEAEQYFAIYPRRGIAHIGAGWKMRRKGDVISAEDSGYYPGDDDTMLPFYWEYRPEDGEAVAAMGGHLPEITRLFYDLKIELPNCYPAKDMPAGGIATAYYFQHKNLASISTILIHRELAEKLIAARAIAEKHLRPAFVAESLPAGYICMDAPAAPHPTEEYMEENRRAYAAFAALPRPKRTTTEKDALKALRNAKKERKADFPKAFPKAKIAELAGTPYEALAPYYQIANGGYLSDEYELLAYASALQVTAEFEADITAEELLAEKPKGVVIAKCPDGDKIILCEGGTVIRFSHEEPTATEVWSSPAQFIFEASE